VAGSNEALAHQWRAATSIGRRGVVVTLAMIAIVSAACTSKNNNTGGEASSQPKPSGKVGNLLTVAYSSEPQTLDPAKTVQNNSLYQALAYEPLIVRKSDGSLAPGLATSWKYVGDNNTQLELQLRAGVKYSDGSVLTAQNVVDHFKYVVKAGGQYAPIFADDTFTASGPLTFVIKAAKPNPDLPTLLTQDNVVGGVISPTGLQNKAKLGTETFGAGPYMLDKAATVTGDHYTFVPNPNYYDKPSVHWKKVVVRAITSPQSTLNALKTGQVQFAVGDATTLSAARQAGLTITSTPLLWTGLTLADRGGKVSKPLADVRVRQALNYATDRATIATALYPDGGRPTAQLTVPGGYGYDADLQKLYDAAAKASGTAKEAADRQVEAWLVHQAWFVPVVTTGLPFYATKAVTGTSVSAKAPLASIYEVQPAT
jgi:peptide/nickel transport system substrate-binding protein